MNSDILKKIEDYLKIHKKMTLATASADGQPIAHTVQFVSEGSKVYFFTKPQARKVANIIKNKRVAFAVDQEYDDWNNIQGVQLMGIASIIEDEDEKMRVFGLLKQKFAQLAKAPDEFAKRHHIIRIDPAQGRFIDNTVSFGHHDDISY